LTLGHAGAPSILETSEGLSSSLVASGGGFKGLMMDVRLLVTNDYTERVRTAIFAFMSSLESHAEESAGFVCVTVMPIKDAWEYLIHFADPSEGRDFLALLPSIYPEGAIASRAINADTGRSSANPTREPRELLGVGLSV
jgi:hypothetical protein